MLALGHYRSHVMLTGLLAVILPMAGCTSPLNWWHNGCKVGPEYCRPPAAVASAWIDVDDPHVDSQATDYSYWWQVFDDAVLNELIDTAYRQNLPLQIAGYRVLEARAQRGIAAGSLFPQQQQMIGDFSRNQFSENAFPFGDFPGKKGFDEWRMGFDAAWELDIWGKFRRLVQSADANLDAQVEDYDDVLVILQAEVAAAYIQMRVLEQQLLLARQNAEIQQRTRDITEKRFLRGVVSELDLRQAGAQLAVTESLIPQAEESLRKMQNVLCLLLGVPPGSLDVQLREPMPIPTPPAEVVVGIPAELLRRRPDVRRAERFAAAQSARIGVAEAEFYPHIAITGTILIDSQYLNDLFRGDSFAGRVGPGFRWNILNYGRIRNSVRVEDARFQRAVLEYQNTVLAANKEAEDAIIAFLRERQRVAKLELAVGEISRALEIGLHLYEQGVIDFQRVLDSQRARVLQQGALTASQGKVATDLVAAYKALGGGWQIRLNPPPAETIQLVPPVE